MSFLLIPSLKTSSSISFAPSIRLILDSPLEDSVSLLGLRRQAAQSQLVCGRRIRLTVVGVPPVSGLIGKNW